MDMQQEIWSALHKQLRTIYECEAGGCGKCEWTVTPHRKDGVGTRLFFISETAMIPPGATHHYQLWN